MRRQRPGKASAHDDITGLAGWLYTDLLLALAVVFLGAASYVLAVSSSVVGEAEEDLQQTTTSSTTTTTSTTVPTTQAPEELCTALGGEDQIFRVSELDTTWDDSTLKKQTEEKILQGLDEKNLPADTPVGFSLAFGGPELTAGAKRAEKLTSRLKDLLPDRLELMQFRSYGDTALSSTKVYVDMFPLITTTCSR